MNPLYLQPLRLINNQVILDETQHNGSGACLALPDSDRLRAPWRWVWTYSTASARG